MQSYIRELEQIQSGIQEAVLQLREQQALIYEIDHPSNHQALVCLLSNGLRMYCWLEDRQRGLAEKIGEFQPMRRG